MTKKTAIFKTQSLKAIWVKENLEAATQLQIFLAETISNLQLSITQSFPETLEQIAQQDYDLIFISLALLKKQSNRSLVPWNDLCLPIVAILEAEHPEMIEQALDLGAVDYLIPSELDRKAIERTLRYALRFRQIRAHLSRNPVKSKNLATEGDRFIDSSEKFQEILISSLNALADPVFIKDENHRFLFVNQALCQLMGRTSEEVIGLSDYDFFPKEQADIFWEKDELVIQTGCPNENEEELTDGSGETQVILTKKSALQMPNGRKILVGIIRDLTPYKKQERALISSERKFSQLAANVPGMIYQFCLTSAGERSFLYVSEGCREIYEVEPEAVKEDANFLFQSIHLDDLPLVEMSIAISAKTLQPWRCEWRILSSSGSVKWLKGASNPDLQANGDIIWNGLVIDMTEQKLAQQERDRFFTLSLELLCIASFDGYFRRLNPAWSSTFGYSEAELLSVKFIDLVHPEDRPGTLTEVQKLAEGAQVIKFENRYRCKDGSYRWLSWVSAPFMEEGLIYAVARDISDRKGAEEALQRSEAREREKAQQLKKTIHKLTSTQAQLVQTEKMASLGQLVAGVAHEINNPVNFISGNVTHAWDYACDLLKVIELYQQHYSFPNAEFQEAIEAYDLDFLKSDFPRLIQSMQEGASRIKEIVTSLRNFSRLDEAQVKEVNLHQGIESTLMILQHRLKEQRERMGELEVYRPTIQVIKEFGDLPLVECYPGQLNQVFMNILSNAIDALEDYYFSSPSTEPKRIPTIWIRTTTQKKPNPFIGSNVVIRIADNAKGIPLEIKNRLFDPFFTTKPIGKGTGLGLYISHQVVVDKHQGSLTCHSELGKGTEFMIELNLNT